MRPADGVERTRPGPAVKEILLFGFRGSDDQEFSSFEPAPIRWLQAVFAKAEENDAKAVLIGLQADIQAFFSSPFRRRCG